MDFHSKASESPHLGTREVLDDVQNRREHISESRDRTEELVATLKQHRLQQVWTEAACDIATELVAGADTATALQLIADKATTLTTAGHCLLVVPRHLGTPTPEAAGLVAVDSVGSRRDGAGDLLTVVDRAVRTVLVEGAPLHLAALDDAGDTPIGPVLMLPLMGTGSVSAVLVIVRPLAAPRFADELVDMMSMFADHVATALRSVTARCQLEMDEREERDRAAHDLHDRMMQRLFATRASLYDTGPFAGEPDVLQRASDAIDEMQYVAQEVWSTIFDLYPGGVDDLRPRRQHDATIQTARDSLKRGPSASAFVTDGRCATPADHSDAVVHGADLRRDE